MTSISSSPGPNPTVTPQPAKQTRSRKAAAPKTTPQTAAGRAGSAGGIVLEKEIAKKNTASAKDNTASSTQDAVPETTTGQTQPRRKPRKLNKDPVTAPATSTTTGTSTSKPQSDPAATAELEALKSRVRGLEAKVEELYKTGTLEHSNRSPRRRGKGRKNSSQQQVPTISSTTRAPEESPRVQEVFDADEAEAEEELVRLEGELEVARQDLEQYRPRNRRRTSQKTAVDDDDVEEIPRDAPAPDRHVTLSGSYRIPLPAAVNTEDLKTIQSGVSAAQNVARTFLEQRRAARVSNTQSQPQASSQTQAQTQQTRRPTPKSVNSSLQVIPDSQGDKQSWSEWIGGYSMAITRAVKNIEHEAAVESQSGSGGARKAGTGTGKKSGAGGGGAAKRPGVKTRTSGE